MRDFVADLRYASRALLGHRSFALAAVLTLGLGIGLTTAIFTIINGVVLQPLPLRNEQRLITLCEHYPGSTRDWCSISPPNVADIAERARSIEAIGIARSWPFTMTTAEGNSSVAGGLATPGAFEALGFRAELGRLLEPADLIGQPSVVAVITHEMWQSKFGGATDIVGRSVSLDGAPVTIVGVLERGAQAPVLSPVELWRPPHIDPRSENHREWRGFVAFGRLREGASLKSARAELAGITSELRGTHFATTAGWDIEPRTLHDLVVGDVREPLLLFFGAVFLVLLIACANVANLILARGASRGREIAVRAALGGRRGRLVQSLLAESLLIAFAGAAMGLGLSVWATQAFKALAPSGIPRIEQVGTNGTVLAFTIVLALVTSVVFGLVPALRVSRVDLAQALREGGRSGTKRGGRLGRALVMAELAIALPLVSGATLLARSYMAQTQWTPGFEREHLLTFSLYIPSSSYAQRSNIGDIWNRLEQDIASIAGVTGVGTASAGPLFGSRETWEMEIEGRPGDEKTSIRWYDVSPGFFDALGVPLVRGRDFGAGDTFGAPSAALVNATLANAHWPGENPIGKRVMFPVGEQKETFTIAGVVRDIPSLRPGTPAGPQLYWSNRQAPRPFTYFLVRTTVPPASIAPAVRARLSAVNKDFEPRGFETMEELVARNVRSPRFNMTLILALGLVALVLAGIGTYGLLAYYVEQRHREIGIRLALGARRETVVAAIMSNGLKLALAGVSAGVVGALLLARVIGTFVWGVSPYDPVTLAGSAFVVVTIAAAACLIPAWRASRVDPAVTLATE